MSQMYVQKHSLVFSRISWFLQVPSYAQTVDVYCVKHWISKSNNSASYNSSLINDIVANVQKIYLDHFRSHLVQ